MAGNDPDGTTMGEPEYEGTSYIPSDEVRRILEETIVRPIFAATHKRRVALRWGVRESSEVVPFCDHEEWDYPHSWCNYCGITKFELMENGP